MKKKEVKQRVLQNGKPLDLKKFEWDEETNTFSSDEDNLVLDFKSINSCTFNTGSRCTFKTGKECVVVRRDIYEVIELEEGKEIKLNDFEVRGHTIINGKKSELLNKADELIKKAEELKEEANKL